MDEDLRGFQNLVGLPGLIDNMGRQAFWDDPEHQEKILAGLPNYRLSKFQPTLPDRFAAETVGRYLLDEHKRFSSFPLSTELIRWDLGRWRH